VVRDQKGASGGRDLIAVSRSVRSLSANVTDVLEQRQGRVDDPRTRAIAATRTLVDGADDVVAVSRLLVEQGQHHVPQLAIVEETPVAPSTRATPGRHCCLLPARSLRHHGNGKR